MEKIAYQGWPNCIRLQNSAAELIITADVGPRIIRYALPGKPNMLREDAESLGRHGDAEFRSYGGHRLWHAPESNPRTYMPDNNPVQVEQTAAGMRFIPPPEAKTGIQKEWTVQMAKDTPRVSVLHRLTNIGIWPVRLAPWAITVMAQGGVGILPLPPRGPHSENLTPASTMALWAYTDMTDPRWHWGGQFILLRQDATRPQPQKIGVSGFPGWAGYASSAGLFIKLFSQDPSLAYPDMNVSAELFTNDKILEVESLGPMTTLEPGESVDHHEEWRLFDAVPLPQSDADVTRTILPKVESFMAEVARGS
jgi:hypothetical protein